MQYVSNSTFSFVNWIVGIVIHQVKSESEKSDIIFEYSCIM